MRNRKFPCCGLTIRLFARASPGSEVIPRGGGGGGRRRTFYPLPDPLPITTRTLF